MWKSLWEVLLRKNYFSRRDEWKHPLKLNYFKKRRMIAFIEDLLH